MDKQPENGFYMATFINEHKEKRSLGVDYIDGKWFYNGEEYELEPIEWEKI